MKRLLSLKTSFQSCMKNVKFFIANIVPFKFCHKINLNITRLLNIINKLTSIILKYLDHDQCRSCYCIRSFMLCNQGLQLIGVRSHHISHLGFFFDENESWHSTDVVFLCCIFIFVHIHFQKYYFWHFTRRCLDLRSNYLAWSTPRGKEVNDNQLVTGGFELFLQFSKTSTLFHHFACFVIYEVLDSKLEIVKRVI